MTATRTPVVFIHGLWLHATSWTPWLDFFRKAGYDPIAPGWPGEPDTVEQARQQPELVANTSIDDAAAHYTKIIHSLDARPIIIGHSFGALIAEKLLGQNTGVAAVAIDPAQIKGVFPLPLPQLRATMPALSDLANLRKAVSLTREEFRLSFGSALTETESGKLYNKWAVPAPVRPLFQAAVANFSLHSEVRVNPVSEVRGPLLLISGAQDHNGPIVTTQSTMKQYRNSTAITELKELQHRGHALTIDASWKETASPVLEWLRAQGL